VARRGGSAMRVVDGVPSSESPSLGRKPFRAATTTTMLVHGRAIVAPDISGASTRSCSGAKGVWGQGRLYKWAHWTRAQGPRIFFFLKGPQLTVMK